jgi:hypothetical protein
MSKSVKTEPKISKNLFFRKNLFGQKLKFLAHSGGWIVLKIICWPIFSHLVSKLIGFWAIIALLMGILFCKSKTTTMGRFVKKRSGDFLQSSYFEPRRGP